MYIRPKKCIETLRQTNRAKELMPGYLADLKPAAYELVYANDNVVNYPLELKQTLDGKALIWYNTLWDTLCGGHDDDRALTDPDGALGFLIDNLGATYIITDRSELLIDFLSTMGFRKK